MTPAAVIIIKYHVTVCLCSIQSSIQSERNRNTPKTLIEWPPGSLRPHLYANTIHLMCTLLHNTIQRNRVMSYRRASHQGTKRCMVYMSNALIEKSQKVEFVMYFLTHIMHSIGTMGDHYDFRLKWVEQRLLNFYNVPTCLLYKFI